MRILITGGFGYLGGRLAQYFSTKTNYNIILGTRKNPVSPEWLPQVKVVKTLWNSATDLEKICSNVDVIVHLAGMNASDCAENPLSALEFNGIITERLLQAATRQGVKRFVYLSSAHVYSSPLIGRITEETCPTNLHPYATSHRAGEDVVRYVHSRSEIEGIVIRLSNSFGAPAHIKTNCWMLLINDLCVQAITNEHMVLQSSGGQRRDFITLTDVCRSIEHLIILPTDKLSNGLFNVGGGWNPTILEVAQLISNRIYALTGKKIKIQSNALRMSPSFTDLDYITEKINTTGFELSSSVNDEIDNLIRFCIKHYAL